MASSGRQENVYLCNKHLGILVLVCLVNFFNYKLILILWQMLLPYLYWQMLCQKLWQMLLPVYLFIFGRWKATVVDVATT